MHDFQATFGDLVIDGLAWEVTLGGEVIDLTRTEFEILVALASRPRRVVTDDELVRTVWGDDWFGDDNNLAVHVSKLRHKLGESGQHPRFIRTVRGVGYRFDPGVDRGLAARVPGRSCETLRHQPGAVEVRTDGQLLVTRVHPEGVDVFGHDPRRLMGKYFPVVSNPPWDDHASALQAIEVLVASGVREWTARHVIKRADGTLSHADMATCMDIGGDGRLEQMCFVLVEYGVAGVGGGGSLNSGHCATTRLA